MIARASETRELAHGAKDVQDRVRDAGGLPVVMNLCVIDERNPCASPFFFCLLLCCCAVRAVGWVDADAFVGCALDLREHAIFALHNLLRGNPENQKFVDSVKPSQEWAEDGTVKTKVGVTRK